MDHVGALKSTQTETECPLRPDYVLLDRTVYLLVINEKCKLRGWP